MSSNNGSSSNQPREPAEACHKPLGDDTRSVASHNSHHSKISQRSRGYTTTDVHIDQTSVASRGSYCSKGSQRSRGYSAGRPEGRRRRELSHQGEDDDRSRSSFGSYRIRYRSASREGRRSRSEMRPHHRDHSSEYYGPGDRRRGEGHGYDSRYQRSSSHSGPHRYQVFDGDRRGPSHSEPRYRRRPSRSRSRSAGRELRRELIAEKVEWPPCFDTDGTAFIFHPASGMFFEEKSNFYYDPKNKLYYGTMKKAYFRYDESRDPPFVEEQKADPSQGTPTAPVEPPVVLPSEPIASSKVHVQITKIAVKLKTKKFKKVKPAEVSASSTTKAQKEQVANIEKWTEKQAELKAASSESNVCITTSAMEIKRTKSGEPMCEICKRKFPTVEKLRLHEEKSNLHKENVAKLTKEQGEKRKEPPQTEYHDRAQKRRQLHGPAAEPVILKAQKSLEMKAQTTESEKLGQDNIGHQILQKMGWQQGSSLAKEGGEKEAASDLIRQDWDRIEAIANKRSSREG